MKEDLLHHLWKYSNFDSQNQYTNAGQKVEIIHPGLHNHDAGPDFFNARIRIDNLEWAGNVEIHVKSSDWVAHGHSTDRAYDSVILHVVYDDDKPKKLSSSTVPTLQLMGCIERSVLDKYEAIDFDQSFIPCAEVLKGTEIDKMLKASYIDRLYVEKLEYKSNTISELLNTNSGDWEETFYQLIARSFGQGKNRLPFELLAKAVPLHIIEKEKKSLQRIEALFFGQAGFLNEEPKDDYTASLQKVYRTLKKKYKLQSIESHVWKFSRLRPGNFPTLRIAQLASSYYHHAIRFRSLLEVDDIGSMRDLFQAKASSYWGMHSKFGKVSTSRSTGLGRSSVEGILINAVMPTLFEYGRVLGRPILQERVLNLMGRLNAESNTILLKWKELGLPCQSAIDSQALLHLKKEYCDRKKCLSCAIGTAILK